jgi:hypothetical protein
MSPAASLSLLSSSSLSLRCGAAATTPSATKKRPPTAHMPCRMSPRGPEARASSKGTTAVPRGLNRGFEEGLMEKTGPGGVFTYKMGVFTYKMIDLKRFHI